MKSTPSSQTELVRVPIARSKVKDVLRTEDQPDAHALWLMLHKVYDAMRTMFLLAEALDWPSVVDFQYDLNHVTRSTPLRGRGCMQSRQAFVARVVLERRKAESPFVTTDEDTMRAEAAEDWRAYAVMSADATVSQVQNILGIARHSAEWIHDQVGTCTLTANVRHELLALRWEVLCASDQAEALLEPLIELANRTRTMQRLGRR